MYGEASEWTFSHCALLYTAGIERENEVMSPFAILFEILNIHSVFLPSPKPYKGSGMSLKKTVRIFFAVFGVIFLLIQFIQPDRSNPGFDPSQTLQEDLRPPEHIALLLERGCRDCHSYETRWPFYSFIAPVSWLVAYDVSEGRKNFNMSEWGKYKTNRKFQKLSGVYQEIIDREMPLPKYITLHPEADFTDAERDTLAAWAKSEAQKLMGDDEE